MERISAASNDASLIANFESDAQANFVATDRKPIEQAIDHLRFESAEPPRIKSETSSWVQSHPA